MISSILQFRDTYARGGGPWTYHVSQTFGASVAKAAVLRGLSPNVLTLLSLAFGLATSVAVILLFPWSRVAAACVGLIGWQVAYGLDCADGQLARAAKKTSRGGATLDLLADFGVHTGVATAALMVAPIGSDAIAGGLGGLAMSGWLFAPFYSGIAPPSVGTQAEVGPVRWLFRFARDYGLHIAVLPCVMVAGALSVWILLCGVGFLNTVFFVWALARLAHGQPEAVGTPDR